MDARQTFNVQQKLTSRMTVTSFAIFPSWVIKLSWFSSPQLPRPAATTMALSDKSRSLGCIDIKVFMRGFEGTAILSYARLQVLLEALAVEFILR